MKMKLLMFSAAVVLSGCFAKPQGGGDGPLLTGQASGLDLAAMDPRVSASDNLERHFNGAWQDSVQIPPDQASVSPETVVHDATLAQLKVIAEGAANTSGNPQGSETQKIGDLYASFMDRGRIEPLGPRPLKDELSRINRLRSKSELPALLAYLDSIGVALPFSVQAGPGLKDSGHIVARLEVGGIDLPGPAYYVLDRPDLNALRQEYVAHIGRMLALIGEKDASGEASDAFKIELSMAGASLDAEGRETPLSASPSDLQNLAPDFDWAGFFHACGIASRVDEVTVMRPGHLASTAGIALSLPIPAWQAYLKWQLLNAYAPYLSSAFSEDAEAFYGRTLRGQEQAAPRDLRATALVSTLLGDALGKLYIATNFQDLRKDRAAAIAGNVRDALHQSLTDATWLSPAARQRSLEKLEKVQLLVGYTEFWKDYTGVNIVRDDLVGDVTRARRFEFQRVMAKIGQPRDRDEWPVSPQTTRILYDRASNELVIPAAALQTPYFDPGAEDAVNYGRLGVLIARELSHGFDAGGSRYAADGRFDDLWSDADRQAFAARTRPLEGEYSQYQILPGIHIDGERTLAENVADIAGLELAYKANRIAHPEGGRIDDLSASQRFFAGWSQLMREKSRPQEILRLLLAGRTVPQSLRGNIPVAEQAAYYLSFDVKPTSVPYLPPNQRIQLW